MSDVSDAPGFSVSGFLIESDQPASPCGLIAKSFFNGKTNFLTWKDFNFEIDTYILRDVNNSIINLETNNLVFSTYKQNAFKRDANYHKTQYIDVEDG